MLNQRVLSISPSVTLAIASRAKALAAQGRKIFSFAAGEPDFDTPAHIKAGAARALEKGETKYCPNTGLLALRGAIAEKLRRENGLNYDPSRIVVSNGAKHSLFNIFMALCKEGDEVIVPAPYWLSYPEMIHVAGGRPVFLHGREENDYKITPSELDRAITPRTQAVILNSPSNPIGVVYTAGEIRALAEVIVRRGIYVVSDEVYERMVYEGAAHVSIGSLSKEIFDRTITVNGFSKTYSMTGWRLGYFAGPKDVVDAADALQSHATSGANTFAQYGALEALKGSQACVDDMVRAFGERRTYLHSRLIGIKGLTCVKPMGAFYVLPGISKLGMGSMEFAERLLEKEGVAVVPGAPFGADRNVRLSYACSMENIRDGVDGIERFVRSL